MYKLRHKNVRLLDVKIAHGARASPFLEPLRDATWVESMRTRQLHQASFSIGVILLTDTANSRVGVPGTNTFYLLA